MAKERSAIATIKGYYYQFDYFILQLLKCNNETDSICIEGIEDVDLKTVDESTAIQCKYYAGTEYNHSVIAQPLRYMLDHYLSKANIYFEDILLAHRYDGSGGSSLRVVSAVRQLLSSL